MSQSQREIGTTIFAEGGRENGKTGECTKSVTQKRSEQVARKDSNLAMYKATFAGPLIAMFTNR